MTFTNYKRYTEAIDHINQEWAKGCHCGICKTVDKQESLRFKAFKKHIDKKVQKVYTEPKSTEDLRDW